MAAVRSNERVCMVTGANTGIGKSVVQQLLRRGGFTHIVLACRDEGKARKAMAELLSEAVAERKNSNIAGDPDTQLVFLKLDLGSFAAVRRAADEFKAMHLPLHLLINNAGVLPYITKEACKNSARATADQLEPALQTNFLGPFLFTHLLIGTLLASAPARIINLSSVLHQYGRTNWEVQAHKIDNYPGYAASKLAMTMFAFELQRRYAMHGISAIAVDPGSVETDIWRQEGGQLSAGQLRWFHMLRFFLFISAAKAAAVIVKAACDYTPESMASPNRKVYITPYFHSEMCACFDKLMDMGGIYVGGQERRAASVAYDDDELRNMWEAACKLVGLHQ